MPAIVPFIPAIIGAGAAVTGAEIASKGSQAAAQTTAEATQKALDLQKQMWETQQNQLAPYRQMGYGAVNNLQTLLGISPQPTPAGPGGNFTETKPVTGLAPGTYAPGGPGWSPGVLNPIGGGVSSTWQGPGPNPAFQPGTPGYNAQRGMSGGQVILRAPTGETKAYPPGDPTIQAALQAGAQQVG